MGKEDVCDLARPLRSLFIPMCASNWCDFQSIHGFFLRGPLRLWCTECLRSPRGTRPHQPSTVPELPMEESALVSCAGPGGSKLCLVRHKSPEPQFRWCTPTSHVGPRVSNLCPAQHPGAIHQRSAWPAAQVQEVLSSVQHSTRPWCHILDVHLS